MNFWERTKAEIDRQNTTFRWLASKIEVSESTMATWRATNVLPRADHAIRIANLLGVSVEYLVTGEEQNQPNYRPAERDIIRKLSLLPENDLETIQILLDGLVEKNKIDLATKTVG